MQRIIPLTNRHPNMIFQALIFSLRTILERRRVQSGSVKTMVRASPSGM